MWSGVLPHRQAAWRSVAVNPDACFRLWVHQVLCSCAPGPPVPGCEQRCELMCEWVAECGEYIKRVLSHFPKVPGVSGKHLGGEQNGVDQRIN